jgi:SPP1 family predicted phage head-tail adaptor
MTYDKKIVIQKRTGGSGYEPEVWTDFKAVWASVNGLNSREFFAAMAEQAEDTVMFFTRYFKAVDDMTTQDYRIVFRGKVYNITGIDNQGFANMNVKFMARAVNPSGQI